MKLKEEEFKKKLEEMEKMMLDISKKNQAYDSDLSKDYIIFKVDSNYKVNYFLDLGQGYTEKKEEAGRFNIVAVKHFNAFILGDENQNNYLNKKYDYYAYKVVY